MKEIKVFGSLCKDIDIYDLKKDLCALASIADKPKVSDVIFKERKFNMSDVEKYILDFKTSMYSDEVTEIFSFNISSETYEFIHSVLVLDFRCYAGIKESFLKKYLRENNYIKYMKILEKAYEAVEEDFVELITTIKSYNISPADIDLGRDFIGNFFTVYTNISTNKSLTLRPSINISIDVHMGKITMVFRKSRGTELDLFLKAVDFRADTFAFIKNMHSSL